MKKILMQIVDADRKRRESESLEANRVAAANQRILEDMDCQMRRAVAENQLETIDMYTIDDGNTILKVDNRIEAIECIRKWYLDPDFWSDWDRDTHDMISDSIARVDNPDDDDDLQDYSVDIRESVAQSLGFREKCRGQYYLSAADQMGLRLEIRYVR